MPDLINGIEFVTRCSWPTPQLTFAFEDGTADTAGEFGAVRAAFASWAAAVPVLFTEVGRTQSPDVAIDWRPANDPDHSMIGGILAHSDFPPGCGVISDALPKPVHFDDSEHAWSVGAVPGAFDIETVALHELGHILGLQHSDVPGSVMFPTVDDNTTNRVLTPDDLAGIRSLYPTAVLANGTYTVRQKSSGRFLDAHEIEEKDFALVTRPVQDNDTQRWTLTQVGTVFVIRQKNSGRFLDAHESSDDDFRIVTRTAESNASQKWVAMPDVAGSVTLRQLSNRRFMDAHEIEEKDFALVTRPAQGNDTQRWTLTPAGTNTFTIRQRSNGRFMDAHEIASKDFLVVTRPAQNNDTQRWVMSPVGAVYTIVQKSSQRFVDAHEIERQGLRRGVAAEPGQRHAALGAAAEPGRQLHRPAVERRPLRRRARLGVGRLPRRHARRREQRHAALVLRSRLSAMAFIWPLSKTSIPDEMNTSYGPRIDADRWDFHDGIDLPAAVGTPVHAMADGTVHQRRAGGQDSPGQGFGSTHVLLQVVDPTDGRTICSSSICISTASPRASVRARSCIRAT